MSVYASLPVASMGLLLIALIITQLFLDSLSTICDFTNVAPKTMIISLVILLLSVGVSAMLWSVP